MAVKPRRPALPATGGQGRTFAVPGRCWKAGVLANPAVAPPQGDARVTRDHAGPCREPAVRDAVAKWWGGSRGPCRKCPW